MSVYFLPGITGSQETIITIPDSSNIVPDLDQSTSFEIQLTDVVGSSRLLSNPVHPMPGQKGWIRFSQPISGGKDITYGDAYQFVCSGSNSLTTSSGAVDLLSFCVTEDSSILCAMFNNIGNVNFPETPVDWAPSDVSDLILWLDVQDGLTVDGSDTVSAWSDLSANGHDLSQVVTENRPVYSATGLNGQPTITFTDNKSLPFSGIFAATDAMMVFVVCDNSNPSWAGMMQAGGGIFFGNGGAESIYSMDGLTWATPVSSPAVVLFAYDNSIPGKKLGVNTTTYVTNGDTASLGDWWGVGTGNNGGYSWHGNVSAIIMYSRTLNSTEISRVMSYLAERYGITLA